MTLVNPDKGERLAKVLARAGLCSRREAEKWIEAGRVTIDGVAPKGPAINVMPEQKIAVDGVLIPDPARPRLWCYHKPKGLVTTHKDPEGRPTVFERLPADLPRVISIGRLDLNSEGLLLLTNDGAVARHLELPATGWLRRYRVRVHGHPDPAKLSALAKGVTVDGIAYGPITAVLETQKASNAWLVVSLREGKNREIRKVLDHIGLPVSRLIRTAYGPFQLGNLEAGQVREVPRKVLADQLGPRFAGGKT
jgi:23S rRNA pseudouridine2605 synthase